MVLVLLVLSVVVVRGKGGGRDKLCPVVVVAVVGEGREGQGNMYKMYVVTQIRYK